MAGQDEPFLATPLSCMSGVATQTLSKLDKLNLHNLNDLLFNIPFRYEDRTYISSAHNLPQEQTNSLFLLTISSLPKFKTKLTEFTTHDHEGTQVKLAFFNMTKYQLQLLPVGTVILAWGNMRFDTYGPVPKPVLFHPNFHIVEDNELSLPTRLSPIYHLTRGLSIDKMRELVSSALKVLSVHPLDELVPPRLNPYHMDISTALLLCHNPPVREDHCVVHLEALPSFQRICYEELIAYKLCILELKARQWSKAAPALEYSKESHEQLLKTLPFEPTNAQKRVYQEIMQDCLVNKAMNRLVHGDVGSGKTLVAAMVMEQFAHNGYQCAMLAPTELLAKQHHRKISELFAPLGYEVVLVTGSLKKAERTEVFNKAKTGSAKIFVGTHALFQKDLMYQNLALSIVDEQHRFGVDQREALLDKAPQGSAAHELLMTATPIPRSLQLALFADTDVSTIDELPKGRTPIKTSLISQDRIDEVAQRLRHHCQNGNQAYWVCPLVEDNELLKATSAKERFQYLSNNLPELKIGLLHAQMSDKEKNSTMEDFIKGDINILVATTIVEVGVDVPNASVIVIESANQLGLAQLHQLRGRVGRGSKESYCLLIYNTYSEPSVNKQEEDRRQRARQRLEIMRSTTNGFEIANQDLQMRGPGEFFGTNQAGKENFRFADLNRDYDLITNADNAAKDIFANDMLTARNLILRWFPKVLDVDNGKLSYAMEQVVNKVIS